MADPLPERADLTLYRGDDRVFTFPFEVNVGTEAAPVLEPFDLSGHTALCQIRDGRSKTAALLAELDCEVGTGEVVATLPHTESDKLPDLDEGESAWWDLQLTDGDGLRRTYLFGKVKIQGDVSRDG